MYSPPSTNAPTLPWELIEAIIDQCDKTTLLTLALTCSQLLPRSRLALLADVKLRSQDEALHFHKAIQEHPRLRTFVLSLSISCGGNTSFSLLSVLPRLRHLTFVRQIEWNPDEDMALAEPPQSLPCATSVRSLFIDNVRFTSSVSLHRYVSIFPNLEHLTCEWVVVERRVPLTEGARIKLRTLNMLRNTPCAKELLQMAQLLPTSGKAVNTYSSYQTSVTWWLPVCDLEQSIHGVVDIAHNLDYKAISGITIVLWSTSIRELYLECRQAAQSHPFTQLDQLLRTYSSIHIVLAIHGGVTLNSRKTISWVDEVQKFFPSPGENYKLTDVKYTGVPGHDDRVTALAVSPDGRWVATASTDLTIMLWDVNANDTYISQEWFAHDSDVTGLAFSPDSCQLASTGKDGKLSVWDTTGNAHFTVCDVFINSFEGCAWSGNGALIACVSAFDILIWDAHTFTQLDSPDFAGEFCQIQFSPDGHKLMAFDDFHYIIWDIQPGAFRTILEDDGFPNVSTFSPCGTYVASAYKYEGIRIRGLNGQGSVFLQNQSNSRCLQLIFSRDGLLLLSVFDSQEMRIWDARTGALAQLLRGHEDRLVQACFSPCGKYVASASRDKTVKMWSVKDGSCLAVLPYPETWVTRLVFTPDGTMLWSAAENGTVMGRRVQDIIPVS